MSDGELKYTSDDMQGAVWLTISLISAVWLGIFALVVLPTVM